MFQMDSETLLKFAELFRPLAELFSSTCCNYFIHLQQMISDISIQLSLAYKLAVENKERYNCRETEIN